MDSILQLMLNYQHKCFVLYFDKLKTLEIRWKTNTFNANTLIRMLSEIKNKLNEINSLCKQHKVISFSLFGSATKKSISQINDIDFLVQFSDKMSVLEYSENYFLLLHKLEKLMNKKIDLVSKKSLKNPVLIDEINRTKIDLYAA